MTFVTFYYSIIAQFYFLKQNHEKSYTYLICINPNAGL